MTMTEPKLPPHAGQDAEPGRRHPEAFAALYDLYQTLDCQPAVDRTNLAQESVRVLLAAGLLIPPGVGGGCTQWGVRWGRKDRLVEGPDAEATARQDVADLNSFRDDEPPEVQAKMTRAAVIRRVGVFTEWREEDQVDEQFRGR